MAKLTILIFLLFSSILSFGQKTIVEGVVLDGISGEPMPFVAVRFLDSKIGTFTDTLGHYSFETYYATDTLIFSFSGFIKSCFLSGRKTFVSRVIKIGIDLQI